MKKTLRIMLALALVIAALSVSVSATGTNGFYDISVPEDAGVTITPYAGADKTVVTSKEANVDATDDSAEVYYEGSDRFDVTYTGATANANYGVILVDGSGLPTANSDIYFIDQVKAGEDATSVAFDVYPKTIEATKAPMTLYISSDVEGAQLVSVPMAYVVGYVEAPTFTYGDIKVDNDINNQDRTFLARYLAGGYGIEDRADFCLEACDVKKASDGSFDVNNQDKTVLSRYLAGGYYDSLPQ